MTDDRKPKRYKNILSWFQLTPPSGSGSCSGSRNGSKHVTSQSVNDVPVDSSPSPSIPIPVVEECHNERNERVEMFDVTSLERDPGIRKPICLHLLNEQDNIRRAYVVLGPYQPKLGSYPSTIDGGQGRKFNYKWFKDWPWLEYSVEKDKAYCFPCFLFDTYPSHHPAFTECGFQGWKNVMSKQSGLIGHVGLLNSPHNVAMHKWETLRNPSKHIERAISTQSQQEIANHRLRLITTIESVRLLANKGCAFRGHDESVNSSNAGNFVAVQKSFGRMNLEVQKVLDNAPANAKYTSGLIQRQIANILGNKVEKEFANSIDNDSVIDEFEQSGPRRVRFS